MHDEICAAYADHCQRGVKTKTLASTFCCCTRNRACYTLIQAETHQRLTNLFAVIVVVLDNQAAVWPNADQRVIDKADVYVPTYCCFDPVADPHRAAGAGATTASIRTKNVSLPQGHGDAPHILLLRLKAYSSWRCIHQARETSKQKAYR
ncbi:hypothetical protein MA05_04580 [Comamonas aquatica]|nr:hypothetical protein MA05_04580 [Comamonas aquatica]